MIANLGLRIATHRWPLAVAARLSRGGSICQGPSGSRALALTFDDGPDPRWTPGILTALAAASARATFFCDGRAAAAHPDLVRRQAAEGHEVGTHLWSHARDTVGSDERFRSELHQSQELLSRLTGSPVRLLRFPYGQHGRQSPRQLAHEGISCIHWTASSHDTRLADPDAITARITAAARPGAILLFHDGIADEGPVGPPYLPTRDAGVAALPAILRAFANRGLACQTVTQLLSSRK